MEGADRPTMLLGSWTPCPVAPARDIHCAGPLAVQVLEGDRESGSRWSRQA